MDEEDVVVGGGGLLYSTDVCYLRLGEGGSSLEGGLGLGGLLVALQINLFVLI